MCDLYQGVYFEDPLHFIDWISNCKVKKILKSFNEEFEDDLESDSCSDAIDHDKITSWIDDKLNDIINKLSGLDIVYFSNDRDHLSIFIGTPIDLKFKKKTMSFSKLIEKEMVDLDLIIKSCSKKCVTKKDLKTIGLDKYDIENRFVPVDDAESSSSSSDDEDDESDS